jgi:hypothetical protein
MNVVMVAMIALSDCHLEMAFAPPQNVTVMFKNQLG